MEIIESNQLIAEFIEWVHHPDPDYDKHEMASLRYHSSWNFLMPVVEKIAKYKYEDGQTAYPRTFGMPFDDGMGEITMMVRFNRQQVYHGKDILEATYGAVVNFIIWYNDQKVDDTIAR